MTDTRQIAFTDPARLLIQPSPTADTRTCDVATVSEATLGASSRAHIADVREMLTLLACADDVIRRAFANTQAQLTALVEVEVTRATPDPTIDP